MKILFLSHYFPPESNAPANRTYEHLKEWVKAGDDVTVITNFPNHPTGVLYPGYTNGFSREEMVDGIRVIRVWTYLTPNKGFLRRILNYVVYMKMAVVHSFRVAKPDVIVVTSPQLFTAVAGCIVSILKRKPFVFELRDIWPESIKSVGAMDSSMVISLLEKLELYLYHKADIIISVTDSFVKDLVSRGISREKIVVVKNGVNLELFHPLEIEEKKREKIRLGYNGKFIVSYIGTIGMAHAVDKVVETAKLLQVDESIHFLIVGDGAERENISKKIDMLGLENVSMLGQKTREETITYYGISDAVVVPLKKDPVFRKVIPSKIFEIMASAQPILISVDGEARRIVEDAQCGLYSEPENAEELRKNILLLKNNPEFRTRCVKNALEYVRKNYDRKICAEKMRSILLKMTI